VKTMSGKSELKINPRFAEKYEKYRQKEELQRLKDRYGDRADESGSESSESSSDDSEVELDPETERDFYRTLSLLKKKDPKIYETDARFYSEASTRDDEPSTSKKAVKPIYLKDYERKVILEKEGKYVDDDDSDEEEEARRMERAASPSYIQEQRALKESFRKFIQDSDDDDDDDDDGRDKGGEGSGESQLLTRRIKTQEEKDKEEADFVEWLKGQAELEGPEEVKDMKYLRDYWNDPQLDEKERFLRDYFLNKGYLEEDDDDERYVVQDDVEDSEEDGETFLERQDDFERRYNFRFEEPDAQEIKTYPRNIATSVRSKDDRRKRKREEVKERKTKEKEQKREQLKQLKNLKRTEIMEKLKTLQELTGNEQLAFSHADLEGDFDPQQHEQLMQKFFGDEYYGEEEGEKPQFDDDDELEEHWNWDTWTGEEQEEGFETHSLKVFLFKQMDADYDPNQQTKMQKEKSFEQYLDEYYKLDYEDIIDDLPCRFRYRQVLPNDFGLSTDEILKADDKELNHWCSLKKTCMFRYWLCPHICYNCSVVSVHLLIFSLEAGGEAAEDREEEEILIPKKKMRQEKGPQTEVTAAEDAADKTVEVKKRTERPKWSKKKHRPSGGRLVSGSAGVKIGGREFSRQRLKAYGLNPKRLFFRQLGRQKRKAQEKMAKQKKE
uniref:Protein KRI1 homolog n=1 Tax=Sparus aurata TaxID=8175 RepID=A0A671YMA7_SPAAU